MANRLARYTLKAVCVPLIIVGALALSGAIDATPVIGSPQFDYFGFDMDKPFWPQFVLVNLPMTLAMGLVTALGLFILGPRPGGERRIRHFLLFWVSCFVVIAVWRLFAWRGLPEIAELPGLLRYAIPNGLVSASVLTLLYVFVDWRVRPSTPPRRGLPTALRWWGALAVITIAFGVVTGLVGQLGLLWVAREAMIPLVLVMLVPAILAGFAARQSAGDR